MLKLYYSLNGIVSLFQLLSARCLDPLAFERHDSAGNACCCGAGVSSYKGEHAGRKVLF